MDLNLYYIIIGALFLLVIIIASVAQVKVYSNFNKFNKVNTICGLSGREVARRILDENGLFDVQIIKVKGKLTDYYNHKKKTVALSEEVYEGRTVAASGIAAHECGHAIQYKQGYLPIKFRNFLIPVCNITSRFIWTMLLLGLFGFAFSYYYSTIFLLVLAGFYSLLVILNLITLPVEYNASKRARASLSRIGIIDKNEMVGVKKVLNSAALTYVAEFLTSIVYLLRILLLFSTFSRRD